MYEQIKIKFFSVHDMSSGYDLKKAEIVFKNWDVYVESNDINIMLELYNIKKYIDYEMRLNNWSDKQFAEYKEKCATIPKILGKYFSTISDKNLEYTYNATDREYTDDFWKLICTYKAYQRISPKVLGLLLDSNDSIVWEILKHKKLTKAFGQIIAEHLLRNKHTAKRLISHFLAAHERNNNQLYFPDEFTQEMRDTILDNFVDGEDANINYLYN